jgi:hypothetical protein
MINSKQELTKIKFLLLMKKRFIVIYYNRPETNFLCLLGKLMHFQSGNYKN